MVPLDATTCCKSLEITPILTFDKAISIEISEGCFLTLIIVYVMLGS
jgi:hypothetical protein